MDGRPVEVSSPAHAASRPEVSALAEPWPVEPWPSALARRGEWAGFEALSELVGEGGVAVLSGAGLSTESGIPDYRGASGAAARRPAPMTYQAFVGDPVARRRYWARSHRGWRTIGDSRPNAGHRALAELERLGLLVGVITQNVDGLHAAGGSRRVVDLHGRLDRVRCLGCGETSARRELERRLTAANATWDAVVTAVNPDGDVDLDEVSFDSFTPVDCAACGGLLKPDVVYFGENVPADRVAEAYDLMAGARSLLVVGTSLTVFSGRRFVARAIRDGQPVAVVNQGPTRADDVAAVRLDAPLGAALSALASVVGAR